MKSEKEQTKYIRILFTDCSLTKKRKRPETYCLERPEIASHIPLELKSLVFKLREPFQEPQSLETPRSQDTCRERLSSPTETRFRKFSTITSWYSFLWAESSNPSSSSVKTTATSLKVTASYNIKHVSTQSYNLHWKDSIKQDKEDEPQNGY